MAKTNNLLDIYKQLPKTNCRACGINTCLAFANEVVKGGKRMVDCPFVTPEVAALNDSDTSERASIEKEQARAVELLSGEIAKVGLESIADRIGASVIDGRLVITSLGKQFYIGPDGSVNSECHTAIPWLAIPMLSYALRGGETEPSGVWLPFDELPTGGKWARLFGQRCEKEFKELADGHPDLFGDITAIFSGTAATGDIPADVSMALHPLPRFPLLVCYWKKEQDFESKLRLYFDKTAENNLDIESIYTLCVGLVMMFGKIAHRHN